MTETLSRLATLCNRHHSDDLQYVVSKLVKQIVLTLFDNYTPGCKFTVSFTRFHILYCGKKKKEVDNFSPDSYYV